MPGVTANVYPGLQYTEQNIETIWLSQAIAPFLGGLGLSQAVSPITQKIIFGFLLNTLTLRQL